MWTARRARLLLARAFLALAAGGVAPATMALDLDRLWDFRQPAVSEQRFREALATAQGDDALILHTQIARSFGLRRDFERAREVLRAVQPALATVGSEARVRHGLEWGRTYVSATHPRGSVTEADRAEARRAWAEAEQRARAAALDGLTVDLIHMAAFLDDSPEAQRKVGEPALAVVLQSSQPAAQRWEGSIRNNLGLALNGLGRHEEALAQLQQALALRERAGDVERTHVARWMVAHTLRRLGRLDEAEALQRRLAAEREALGRPDPYVAEELEAIARARGNTAEAEQWRARREAWATPGR
jgi:tetratricopeptide (TPR) repeat protein